MSLCGSCGQRHAQHKGLCRTCERAAGFDTRSDFERDRDRQARRDAALRAARTRRNPNDRSWPAYIVDGVEYEVTWDGQFGASLEDRRRW